MNRLVPFALFAVLAMLPACSKKETPPPAAPRTQPVKAGWVDDPSKMVFPDGPVRGEVEGQEFQLDDVSLFGGHVRLRQGKGAFGDVTIDVGLFGPPEKWQGRTYEFRPNSKESFGPSVAITGERVKVFGNVKDFVLKLALGQNQDGKLPGQIYLCLFDTHKSYLAGNFILPVPIRLAPPSPTEPLSEKFDPCVHGKITVKGKDGGLMRIGYLGRSTKGEPESSGESFPFLPRERYSGSSGVTKFTTFSIAGEPSCAYRHLNMVPGEYLVYVNWERAAADWRWVKVEDKSRLEVNLTVDESAFGRVEVVAPKQPEVRAVTLMPLLEGGKLPPQVIPLYQFGELHLEAKVENGKAIFPKVRAGSFRVLVGDARADLEVVAGKTTTADLSKDE